MKRKGFAILGVLVIVAAVLVGCDTLKNPAAPGVSDDSDAFDVACQVVHKSGAIENAVYNAECEVRTVGFEFVDSGKKRTDETGFTDEINLRIPERATKPKEVWASVSGAVGYGTKSGTFTLRDVWNPRLGLAIPTAQIDLELNR